MIIDLILNENLTPGGHFLRYQTPTGDQIVQNFTKTDIDLCHYKVSLSLIFLIIFKCIKYAIFNLNLNLYLYRAQSETMKNLMLQFPHVVALKALYTMVMKHITLTQRNQIVH